MPPQSISRARQIAKRKLYNPTPLATRLQELLEKSNLSLRNASLGSGLNHQSVRRIISEGKRPTMSDCIVLADYFEVNPNEFLQLAGWPTLKIFDIKTVSAAHLPPEAVDVALDVAKIPDPGTRKQVTEAIRTLLKKYFEES